MYPWNSDYIDALPKNRNFETLASGIEIEPEEIDPSYLFSQNPKPLKIGIQLPRFVLSTSTLSNIWEELDSLSSTTSIEPFIESERFDEPWFLDDIMVKLTPKSQFKVKVKVKKIIHPGPSKFTSIYE